MWCQAYASGPMSIRGLVTKVVAHRSPLSPTKVCNDFCHQPSIPEASHDNPGSAMEKTRNLRAIIAEISILGHPAIRYHPNVANVEGICWDVVLGGEEVWPVLVFEKTRYGDLNRFMTSGPGKELDSKPRLDMLFDVVLAVRDLHAIGRFLKYLLWRHD